MRKSIFLLILGLITSALPLVLYSLYFKLSPNGYNAPVDFPKGLQIIASVAFEEFVFRLLLLKFLLKKMKLKYLAILLQAFLFALCHKYSLVSFIAFTGYTLAGLYYGFYMLLNENPDDSFTWKYLIYPIGLHCGWNYSQVFLMNSSMQYEFELSIESMFFRILILVLVYLSVHIYRVIDRCIPSVPAN